MHIHTNAMMLVKQNLGRSININAHRNGNKSCLVVYLYTRLPRLLELERVLRLAGGAAARRLTVTVVWVGADGPALELATLCATISPASFSWRRFSLAAA